MIRSTLLICSAVLGTALSISPVSAALTIDVSYTGPAQFQSFFDDAATTWENLLVGYQDGQIQAVSAGSSYIGQPLGTPLTSVFIEANLTSIDGVGGTLGSAGPSEVALDGAGFILTTDGSMNFDDADAQNLVNQNTFGFVVLHEMAHVLGFGTLWTNNNVYDPVGNPGEFTGVNATAAWQNEFGQPGTPDVELGGGPGTANGHWNEIDNGAGPTGITDGDNDLQYELMTGWLNSPNVSNDVFISQMTVNSFIDIGFIGSSIAAIPETGSFLAFGLIFGRLATTRRREHAA